MVILCRQQKETASKQPCKEKMKQENLEPERKRCHMENIGAIITSYRKKAHMSQIELADKLQEAGISLRGFSCMYAGSCRFQTVWRNISEAIRMIRWPC